MSSDRSASHAASSGDWRERSGSVGAASGALLAKGIRADLPHGETLVAHTLEVVGRVARLRERSPFLPQLSGDPRFWHRLGLAAALHDLGKADPRFQSMLRVTPSWQRGRSSYDQRHEVVSLAWLDWALGDDPSGDRCWIAAVIASHHRDFSTITAKYSLGTEWEPSSNIADLLAGIPQECFSSTAALFLDTILPEVRTFGLLDPDWPSPPRWEQGVNDRQRAEQSIRRNLRCWESWMQSEQDERSRRLGLLCRGVILLSDHAASAHEEFRRLEALHSITETTRRLAPTKGKSFYPHQDEAAETMGHAILVAPTGSGKTEAALRWAARQYAGMAGHPPLFYVLPFKASMNAMQARLVEKLTDSKTHANESELVALQHSSALQVLYHQLMASDDRRSSGQAEWIARRQQNLARLHTTPIRVLSPYQLLRAAYQLKGHEAIWADAAGGLFIFDEIHAYEPQKLARILEMLRFLVDRLGARAFVMTATMPEPVRKRIAEILGEARVIPAEEETFTKFRRHRLRLCETGLLEDATVSQIVERAKAREAVLCVATTVARAQQLRGKLQTALGTSTKVRLLHGRFTGEDRSEKESELRDLVSTRLCGKRPEQAVLVATQVVEVSLDVDFDVLFSDPAPLEALLQRFGRVNRSLRATPCDVIVCTRAEDANPVYEPEYVVAAIEALRQADHQIIDERDVQTWLDQVYEGAIGARLGRHIEQASHEFNKAVLSQLLPFDTRDDLEDMFLQQFEGAEVLPEARVATYRDYLESKPLACGGLSVPVTRRQYLRLERNRQLVRPQEVGLPTKAPMIAKVPYNAEFGLMLNPPPDLESI